MATNSPIDYRALLVYNPVNKLKADGYKLKAY